MSIDAMRWAWSAEVQKSTERLVLLSLADRADEQNKCYPSMERVAKDTLLDIKTVKKVISDLIEKGFILDTGERKGLTQKVRVLQLVCVKNRENQQENEPKNGTVKQTQKRNDSKNGMNPNLPTNEPKNGTLNEPKIGSQNLPMNLPINKHTNTHEKKTEQAIVDELTKETSVNFLMHFDWQPNQREFEGYCKNLYGIDPKKLTPEIFKKFVGEARSNQQKHNESKWCKFLAAYLKKWADNPQFDKQPNQPNQHIYRPTNGHSQPEQPMRYEVPNKIQVETSNRESDEVRARMAKSLDSLIFGAA